MKKIRVQLEHSYEEGITVPEFLQEFIGKTGTLIWAKEAIFGGFQCDVELDIPHSMFGTQCRTLYIGSGEQYKNNIVGTLIEGSTMQEVARLARILDNNWNRYRQLDGDAFSWEELEKRLPLDTELEL